MNVNSVLRKLNRAFMTKDERTFDSAMDDLEEALEEKKGEDETPEEAIEIHNHIPDSRDTSLGEIPPKEGAEKTFDGEEPPWFKAHREDTDKKFKAMADSIKSMSDRHRDEFPPKEEEKEELEEDTELDPNLEMEDRSRDEPSEREEMAERKEKSAEKDARHDDEANKAILGELEFEAPPGTGDRARKAKDSRYLEDAFQDVLSKAEDIAPGIRLPTFDSKAPPIKTARSILRLRRTALDLAYNKADTRGIIDAAMSGRTMDSRTMSHGVARVLFNTVATQVASDNNRRATDRTTDFGGSRGSARPAAGIQSLADINARNREKFGAAVRR